MKKALCLTLAVLTVVALLGGCQGWGTELSDRKKQELSRVFLAEKGIELDWNGKFNTRYYGTYNGYMIVLSAGMATVMSARVVADYRFEYGSMFQIFACKDGKAYELEDAYEAGLLTKKQIGKIYDRHIHYET